MRSIVLAGSLVVALLTGCAAPSQRDTRVIGGAALGGVVGSMVGHSTAATIGGAAIGGLIGNEVDRRDRERRYNRR